MINFVETSGNGTERHMGVNTRSAILQAYSLFYVLTLRVNCFTFILKLGTSGTCIYIIYIYLSIALVKHSYIMHLHGSEKTTVSKSTPVKSSVKLSMDNSYATKRKFQIFRMMY